MYLRSIAELPGGLPMFAGNKIVSAIQWIVSLSNFIQGYGLSQPKTNFHPYIHVTSLECTCTYVCIHWMTLSESIKALSKLVHYDEYRW